MLRNTPILFSLRLVVASLFFTLPASATWSIIAVDQTSGEIVVASATCLPQSTFVRLGVQDLRNIQAVVVPGKGAAVCQAAMDTTRKNQRLIEAELSKETSPARILELVKEGDGAYESRQFGILDLRGRSASLNGAQNQAVSLSQSGTVGLSIHYQIQGNILAREGVVQNAARAFGKTAGSLGDRVMAAMDAADTEGGDRRCTAGRTAMVAYFLKVDKDGRETYIHVTDEDAANPVQTLRNRYDKLEVRK